MENIQKSLQQLFVHSVVVVVDLNFGVSEVLSVKSRRLVDKLTNHKVITDAVMCVEVLRRTLAKA